MAESGPNADLIGRLAEQYVERYRRGEQPSISEYTRRHPELAGRIREFFPLMLRMEELTLQEPATLAQHPPSTPAANSLQRQLGDYLILREIGRGGMGVVYEAEQISLGRRVAVKTLPAHVDKDESSMARFRREARAAASLHHTNIVPVYEVGRDRSTMYYAMQLIRGESLDDVLHELRYHRENALRVSSSAEYGPSGSSDAQTTASLVAHVLLTGESATADHQGDSQAFDFTGPAAPSEPPRRGAEASEPIGESPHIPLPSHQAISEDNNGDRVGPQVEPTENGAAPNDSARISADTTDSSTAVLPGLSEVSKAEEDVWHYFRSVAHLGVQAADALACAHEADIIHRDIKPSNLLLDAHGKLWITDFGIAKIAGDELTRTGDLLGTLRYMAPERFRGCCEPCSDVYSLGITLYEMLALRPAYGEQDRLKLIHRISHEDPPQLRSVEPRIPKDLETIVFKAIQRDPEQRYRSAREFKDDLQRFLDDRPIAARQVSHHEQLWRWCRRNPAVAALTGTVAVLLLVLAVASTAAAFHFRQIAREREHARDLAVQRQAESQRNFRMAVSAVDQFLIRVSEDPRLATAGLETLRQDLLKTAHEFYAELVEFDSKDPELLAEQGDAFRSLASITKELGSLDEASTLYRRGEHIFRRLIADHPGEPEYRAALAQIRSDLGTVLKQFAHLTEAEAAYDASFTRRASLAMMFKLAQSASKKWRRLRSHEKITSVIEGRSFKDGIMQEAA